MPTLLMSAIGLIGLALLWLVIAVVLWLIGVSLAWIVGIVAAWFVALALLLIYMWFIRTQAKPKWAQISVPRPHQNAPRKRR
jgi:archaellum biogenesis protein FlaJ (TadC family)